MTLMTSLLSHAASVPPRPCGRPRSVADQVMPSGHGAATTIEVSDETPWNTMEHRPVVVILILL